MIWINPGIPHRLFNSNDNLTKPQSRRVYLDLGSHISTTRYGIELLIGRRFVLTIFNDTYFECSMQIKTLIKCISLYNVQYTSDSQVISILRTFSRKWMLIVNRFFWHSIKNTKYPYATIIKIKKYLKNTWYPLNYFELSYLFGYYTRKYQKQRHEERDKTTLQASPCMLLSIYLGFESNVRNHF